MKKFFNYYLSMMLLASLFLVTSCGEDTEDPIVDLPFIEFDGIDEETITVDVGETVAFTVNVTAPGGFNTLVVDQTIGEVTEEFDREGRTAGVPTTTFEYDFTFTPTAEMAGETIIFDFVVVDEGEQESVETITIIVNEEEVVVFPATLLYAPAADGSTESFFSTNTGETFSSNEVTTTAEAVSPLIDFGYFYGQEFGATIASPADFPFEVGQSGWNTRNDTDVKLTTLDQSAFNESTATTINAAFEEAEFGANEGQVRNLEVGDVIAFETDPTKEGGSRRGLIYVQEIDPGTANVDFIEVLVKVIE